MASVRGFGVDEGAEVVGVAIRGVLTGPLEGVVDGEEVIGVVPPEGVALGSEGAVLPGTLRFERSLLGRAGALEASCEDAGTGAVAPESSSSSSSRKLGTEPLPEELSPEPEPSEGVAPVVEPSTGAPEPEVAVGIVVLGAVVATGLETVSTGVTTGRAPGRVIPLIP